MAHLCLSFLGHPLIHLNGVAVTLGRYKAIALLAYLALTQQAQSRAHLATLLWPDDSESTALGYLRHTLWTLTQALGKEWFVCTRTSLALSPQPALWVDVDTLQASVTDPHAAPTMALAQAVTLYRGDFLTGFAVAQAPAFEEWQRQQSERLRALQLAALRQIVHRQLAQDNLTAALATTEQWLALDPLDEAAHVQLMQLYAGTGQRVHALRQYERCVQGLQREVGASPLPSTTTLYHALQQPDAIWRSVLHKPTRAAGG